MSAKKKRSATIAARRFGENLRRARKLLDLSQEELGSRAALHRTEIGQLERGERLPRIDTLIKLCGGLGVEPDTLLTGLVRRQRVDDGAHVTPDPPPRLGAMTVATRFGENLARQRRRLGFTQEELASRAGLHHTHIGMLERGLRRLRTDTLIRLAGALAIDPGALLDGISYVPGDGAMPGVFEIRALSE